MKFFSSIFLSLILTLVATVSAGKDLPKIAVWDLSAGNINPSYAQDLTSILVSEISKLQKYEVYSQENVRTLAGWTAERMQLGCTDTKCLTALGEMDISKLISGRIGKIGNMYSISLHLFDTQNVRAENSISEECKSEDELIPLARQTVRKLLGVEGVSSRVPSLEEEWKRAIPLYFKEVYTGMEFIFVKGGCFEMGDIFGDGDPDEKPVHQVCVDDFYLGKYEVTQGQWDKVMGNPSDPLELLVNYPVVNVSWDDVQQFISRLNSQSGQRYLYRLPTEAEWEYAARSGGKREKYSGTSREGELDQYAWYDKNSNSKTHPVGKKRPNGLGLYDMSGNVWEWCADWFDWDYYQYSPKNNPRGPEIGNIGRVLRGGSRTFHPRYLRAANRNNYNPLLDSGDTGFRLSLSVR